MFIFKAAIKFPRIFETDAKIGAKKNPGEQKHRRNKPANKQRRTTKLRKRTAKNKPASKKNGETNRRTKTAKEYRRKKKRRKKTFPFGVAQKLLEPIGALQGHGRWGGGKIK